MSTPINPAPAQPEQPTKHNRTKAALIGGAVLLTLVSCGVGKSLGSGSTLPPTPTKTITKEVVPYECTKALDHADGVDAIIPRFADSSSKALTAAGQQDITGLEEATAEIQQQTEELSPLVHDYVTARDTCRAKAQQ